MSKKKTRTQSELPVYQKARHLVLQIYESTKKSPVWIKRDTIQKYLNMGVEVMVLASFANRQHEPGERAARLRKAIANMQEIEVGIRLVYDLGYLSNSGFSAIMRYEAEVTQQLYGWLKSTEGEIPCAMDSTSTAQPVLDPPLAD